MRQTKPTTVGELIQAYGGAPSPHGGLIGISSYAGTPSIIISNWNKPLLKLYMFGPFAAFIFKMRGEIMGVFTINMGKEDGYSRRNLTRISYGNLIKRLQGNIDQMKRFDFEPYEFTTPEMDAIIIATQMNGE